MYARVTTVEPHQEQIAEATRPCSSRLSGGTWRGRTDTRYDMWRSRRKERHTDSASQLLA